MPKLWSETIQTHRQEVNDAILETTAGLVAEHGLRGVTMSQIAERTGIGRATLYKYFPDVEAILVAWHERHVAAHVDQLVELRDRASSPSDRLRSVLEGYASILYELARQHHGGDLTALLHQGPHHVRVEHHLSQLIAELLVDATGSGDVRNDIGIEELVTYCTHSLSAASTLGSSDAVRRLVVLTVAGIRPSPAATDADLLDGVG
ncbi:MAG TPA: TetR/AcrR family transcriptional regulator [Acidimicrobiales bacterium]